MISTVPWLRELSRNGVACVCLVMTWVTAACAPEAIDPPGDAVARGDLDASVGQDHLAPPVDVSESGDAVPAEPVRAFPGAAGFGRDAIGGRGGRVIYVTNTDNSGAGSLRDAIEAQGPRIVIVAVAGLVALQSKLSVANPYLTLAAQTAPGNGFAIRNAALTISAPHVIVRGLRVRAGDAEVGQSKTGRDGLTISNFDTEQDVHDVIVDHCSFAWSVDEGASVYRCPQSRCPEHPEVRDVTIQWSIVAEPLRDAGHLDESGVIDEHSMSFLVGNESRRVTLHHVLLSSGRYRNPRIANASEIEVVNNVVYNWGVHGMEISGSSVTAHVLENLWQPGPATGATGLTRTFRADDSGAVLYLDGNIRGVPDAFEPYATFDLETPTLASQPLFASSLVAEPVLDAYERVLDGAGATWPRRDTVDERVIRDVREGTGGIIDSQDEVGGFPSYQAGAYPLDSDADGMPDDWEKLHGLDAEDPADGAADRDSDGYTNVEEYLNSFFSADP